MSDNTRRATGFSSRIAGTGRIERPVEAIQWQVSPLEPMVTDDAIEVDELSLQMGRLLKLRAELRKRDYAGALLSDPINIRYATGARNMAIWTMREGGRYAFVATDGPVILFEFAATRHLGRGFPTIDEIRTGTGWTYFIAGPRLEEKASLWAEEVASLVWQHGGRNHRLAVDRCNPAGTRRLTSRGIELFDAQEVLEQARLIKTPDEISCIRNAMVVCDLAVDRMRASLRPGITENQLWSVLHDTNIAHGGEWIECRLLASGERTNPWFQESSDRIIRAGDVVGFDTDMVGPHGYLADISRSYVCPGSRPTDSQRMLYETAQNQVVHNLDLLRPGLGFREFIEKAWAVPERFVSNRYMTLIHGVGMVDEFPGIVYKEDFADWGYDGVFEENMVVSVESYIGEQGGVEGVKLEQQVLITANGVEVLSRSPFEDAIEA
jgi:Xaa-Pro aminopeptidase